MAKHFSSYQRSPGNWRCVVRYPGTEPVAQSGFPTKDEADRWGRGEVAKQDTMIRQAAREGRTPHQELTIGDMLSIFERDLLPHRKGREFEAKRIAVFRRHALVNTPIAGNVVGALQAYVDERTSGPKAIKGQSIARDMSVLATVFSELARTPYNITMPVAAPTRALRLPKPAPKKVAKIWSEADLKLWMDHLGWDIERPPATFFDELPWLLNLLATTGLRPGSLIATRHEWLELDQRQVRYPCDVVKNGEEYLCPLDEGALLLFQKLAQHAATRPTLFTADYATLGEYYRRERRVLAATHPHLAELIIYGHRHTWTTRNARFFRNPLEFLTYTGRKSVKDALTYMRPDGASQATMLEERRRKETGDDPATAELRAVMQQQQVMLEQQRAMIEALTKALGVATPETPAASANVVPLKRR